jgi:cytochrome P450
MTHITADIIFRTILSRQLGKEDAEEIYIAFNKYQQYAQYYAALSSYLLPTTLIKHKMKRQAKLIHNVFAPISKERHDKFHKIIAEGGTPPNNDILDALMSAKSSKTGDYFSYKDIIDQLSIIFLAGHETSASTLTWSLYLLSQCPNLQDDLFNEISTVIKNNDINFEDMKKLEGVNNLFNESLRLYPPVSFLPREATQNLEMRGKKIKPGDMITVSPWLLQRNSNYWQKPHEFNISRWANESTKESIKECFIPFGKGERICIGAGFARQEAVLILAHIIYNFNVTLPVGQKIEAISRLTTRPKKPIRLQFTKR